MFTTLYQAKTTLQRRVRVELDYYGKKTHTPKQKEITSDKAEGQPLEQEEGYVERALLRVVHEQWFEADAELAAVEVDVLVVLGCPLPLFRPLEHRRPASPRPAEAPEGGHNKACMRTHRARGLSSR